MEILKNKSFLYPLILCLIVGVLFGINYYSFGNILYDCGREFFVSEEISKGIVPIKDIFLSYFPFSYQINGFLFKIFGSNFDVLRGAGIISALITINFIYLIFKEFVEDKKAFIFTLIVSLLSMFNVSYIFNYVMGYSYAFIYGVLALFVSLYFALKYLKEDKFLYLSYFFLGVCFALKADFVFLIIPYFLLLIYKKTPIKKIIISHLIYSLPIVFSFSILFLQGFNFQDLINYFNFLKDFMNSSILKVYNQIIFIKEPISWVKYHIKSFSIFITSFGLLFISLYIPIKKNIKWFYYAVLSLFFVVYFFAYVSYNTPSSHFVFSYLCLTTIFILIKSIIKKDIPLVFLCLIQLFLAVRFNFIYTGNYSAYIIPIALIVNIIYFSNTKFEVFNKALISYLLLFSTLMTFSYTLSQVLFSVHKIETKKGIIKIAEKEVAKTINETLVFLNRIGDKKVLILPDGVGINYLSDKKTNLKYYQLLPNHIEVLGEDKIVQDLEKEKIDYFLITNLDYSIYGTPRFCDYFGRKICKFVVDNYDFVGSISYSKELEFKIFKIKTP